MARSVKECKLSVTCLDLHFNSKQTNTAFFYFLILLTDPVIAAVAGIMTATGIRLLAIKYNWNLPKARIS